MLAGSAAHAQSRWTANAQFAIAIGDQTDGSLAFRGGIYRWLRDSQALGIEAGMFSWDGREKPLLDRYANAANLAGYYGEGPDPTLQFIGGSMRVRGLREAANSAPYFALSIGAYRQSAVSTVYGDIRCTRRIHTARRQRHVRRRRDSRAQAVHGISLRLGRHEAGPEQLLQRWDWSAARSLAVLPRDRRPR
jgi:hypothetical protein